MTRFAIAGAEIFDGSKRRAQHAVIVDHARILDVVPESLHQRVPLIIGSTEDVRLYEKFCREAVAAEKNAEKVTQ